MQNEIDLSALERSKTCLVAIHDVIHARNVSKDSKTPIFGSAPTLLLPLSFIILLDDIERKAKNMGVWEVINGRDSLEHNVPLDAEARLIRNLKRRIDAEISNASAKNKTELVMEYQKLSQKDIISTFNRRNIGLGHQLEIPNDLFISAEYRPAERLALAHLRNTSYLTPFVPACDANPLTPFVINQWTTWRRLTRLEFFEAVNRYGTPFPLLGTNGPIFEHCESIAYGLAQDRGNYDLTNTNAEIRTLAQAYGVLVEEETNMSLLTSKHKTNTAIDKATNTSCLQFFETTFSPPILSLVHARIVAEDWAGAWTFIHAQYSVNAPNRKLPTADILAATALLKHDLHRFKVSETMNVFETLLVLLSVAHHTNDTTSPRPGTTMPQIKLNLRSSLPLSDSAFSISYPGVTRYVKDYSIRDLLLGVFAGVDHYAHMIEGWKFRKLDVLYPAILQQLIAQEAVPLKTPRPFAAAVGFDPMDPSSSSSSSPNPPLPPTDGHTALAVSSARPTAVQLALRVPCVLCFANPQRHAAAQSHDAARCHGLKHIADSPPLARSKGFPTDMTSIGLPTIADLISLGTSLGPMAKRDSLARQSSPSSQILGDKNKRPFPSSPNRFNPRTGSPATVPNSEKRPRYNPRTGSRQNSRQGSPASSRPSSPSHHPRSPGGSILPRPPSPGSATTTQDPFVRGLQNPAFAEMLRSAIEKTVEKAMADRK